MAKQRSIPGSGATTARATAGRLCKVKLTMDIDGIGKRGDVTTAPEADANLWASRGMCGILAYPKPDDEAPISPLIPKQDD